MTKEKLKQRLLRAALIADKHEIGILQELNSVNDRVDVVEVKVDDVQKTAEEALKVAETTSKTVVKGEKGDMPSREELTAIIEPLIPEPIKGDAGDDYVLTDKDKKEIASKIPVPVVEKVIERTEVIKEIPIVTENVVEKAVADTPEVIVEKLESLEGEKRLDAKAIKNLPQPRGGGGMSTLALNHRLQDVATDIIPTTDSTYSLGSTSKRWLKGWFDGIEETTPTYLKLDQTTPQTMTGLSDGYIRVDSGVVSTSEVDTTSLQRWTFMIS